MTLAAMAMANVRTMKITSRTEIMTIRPYANRPWVRAPLA